MFKVIESGWLFVVKEKERGRGVPSEIIVSACGRVIYAHGVILEGCGVVLCCVEG
jgi:hypothetical protein